MSPYVVLGEDAHVRTHDNLDSNVVWYKILAESGLIFAPVGTEVPNMLNGVPREAFGSEFNVILWLFVLFEPFTAYVINETIMRLVAFFGMLLLLRRHLLRKDEEELLATGVALAFSFLPFLPTSGLSFAGLPLVLYVFLNFRTGTATKKDWLVLLIVPFYASLVLTFSFFLAGIGIWWLVDWLRTKRFNGKWLTALLAMGALFLCVEYRLVYGLFVDSGVSLHRQEFFLGAKSVAGSMVLAIKDFFKAHTHDISLHTYIVLPAVGLALISRWRGKRVKLLWFLLVLQLVFSVWYGFWYWEGMRVLKDSAELFNTFNFSRFHFLGQFLWYVAFALALGILSRKHKWTKIAAIGILVLQLGYVTYAAHPEIKYTRHDVVSYREFYAQDLMQEVQHYIGKDPKDYRVVSIGLHPAVPQYSGFYTVDGYMTMYPLAHKHAFRDVIAPELAKNKTLQQYYDNWGSRCYMFVDELGKKYEFRKDEEKSLDNLTIDSEALKALGGDYVLSTVRINNSEKIKLQLLETFERASSPWRIFLYKVQ